MLNLDSVINVNVNIGTSIPDAGIFDIGAILGPTVVTDVLGPSNRFAEFDSPAAMIEAGFTTTDPEYKAALKYFSVDPAPRKVVVINFAVTDGTTETPVTALAAAIAEGVEFYSLFYCPKASETEANIKTYVTGLASALEALNRGVLFVGVTGTASAVTGSGSILEALYNAKTNRALVVAGDVKNDADAVMGEAMGLSRMHNDKSSFSLCYKKVNSATVSDYTQGNIDTIKAMNGNVYVSRMKGHSGLENGALASGLRFDEILYLDRIVYEIQRALYGILEDQVRLPQNDSTTTLFLNAIDNVLENYYAAGVLDTQIWQGVPTYGINTGDTIEHGHASFADSFDEQTIENRVARKAMPITILLCLSGSVETVQITVNVQT